MSERPDEKNMRVKKEMAARKQKTLTTLRKTPKAQVNVMVQEHLAETSKSILTDLRTWHDEELARAASCEIFVAEYPEQYADSGWQNPLPQIIQIIQPRHGMEPLIKEYRIGYPTLTTKPS